MSDIPGHGVDIGDAESLVNKAEKFAEQAYECLGRAAQDASLSGRDKLALSNLKASAKKLRDSIGDFLSMFEQ